MSLLGFVDCRKVWDYSSLKLHALGSLNDKISSQEMKRREIQAEHDHLMKIMQEKQVNVMQ